MADRLSMSLDAIIASKEKKHPPKRSAAAKSSQRPAGGKQQQQQAPRHVPSHHQMDDEDAPKGVMKVVTVSRPKVLKASSAAPHAAIVRPTAAAPAAAQQRGSSSVFQRLGAAGFSVRFSNLKRTVVEADIAELCGAVGQVSQIRMEQGGAVAVFSSEQDAQAAAAKYNGLTLDGLPMYVAAEAPSQVPQTVFSRIAVPASASASAHTQQHADAGNVRQGLFGTALGGMRNPNPSQQPAAVSFTVQMQGQGQGRTVKAVGSGDREHGQGGGQKRQQQQAQAQQQTQPRKKAPATPMSLDDDLDNYFAGKR